MAYGDVTSTSSQEATGTTAHEVALPTLANNDFLIVSFAVSGSTADVATTPTGWTLVERHAVYLRNMYLFTRRADGTEGATLTVTTSASVTSSHCAMAVEKAKLNTQAPDDSDTGGTTMTAGAFAAESSPDPYLVLVAYCNWGGTETISTWPTSFTLGRQDETLASNSSSICATALVATTGIAKSHTKGGSSQWLAAAISLIEDTSTPPVAPTTITGTTAATGGVIGVGVDGINAITSCTGSLTASEIRSANIDATTVAAGQVRGLGLSAEPPDDLAGITLSSVTNATGSVVEDEAAETTDITGITGCFGDMAASPVSSAVLMSMTTGAYGSLTGPGPIISAQINATTSASGQASDNPPSFAAGAGLNCCCLENDPPDCSVQIYFGPLERQFAESSEPADDFGNSLTRARLGIGVSATDGATYRIEVFMGGVRQIDTEQVLGTWGATQIVEENKTILVKVTGITSPCESTRSCEFYGYPPDDCFKGFFTASAAGQCFNGWREEWEYRVAPPTHSVQVSGLVGPMSPLNGVYSVNECDPFASAGLCWKGEDWPLPGVNFGINLAWVTVRMGVAGATAQVVTLHDWSGLRSRIDNGLVFDCCDALDSPPFLQQLGPSGDDLYWCDSRIEAIRASSSASSTITEHIVSINNKTRVTTCDGLNYPDPCQDIELPISGGGRVYLGFSVTEESSTGNCTYDDGFGTVLVAEACGSSAVLTWLS